MLPGSSDPLAKANVVFVLNWAMQFVMLISGTLFGMKKASVLHLLLYVSRLWLVFSVGVAANWMAFTSTGGYDELHNDWDVVHHMAWIFLIVLGAILSFPIKWALDKSTKRTAGVIALMYFVVLTVAVVLQSYTVDDIILRSFSCSLGLLFIMAGGIAIVPPAWKGMIGWVLFLCLYVTQVVFATESNVPYFFHMVDLYTWAVFVQRVPLFGDGAVGLLTIRCFPFCTLLFGLLAFPGEVGRKNKDPFEDPIDRARWYLIEELLCLAFIVIPRVGLPDSVPMADVLKPHLPWLNWWCLAAFTFHLAAWELLASTSISLKMLVMLGSMIPFCMCWKLLAWSKRGRTQTSIVPPQDSLRSRNFL
jgi:hypothetical protein